MARIQGFGVVRILAGGALAFLASPASAQFMKPGASPESGLAGTWRVIAAIPAPWDHAAGATGGKSLLEYAVRFSDGEAKGPPALACAHAKYASGVTAPDELFDGKLKASGGGADKLELTDASVTTFRVFCGDATRDYYIDAHANLRTYEAGVVYTLERPTGMETQRYEPGFSGPSFDCTKAKTAGEQTICRDAALSEADRKLDAAYRRLKSTLTAASFATVQKSQRDWLAYVAKSCRADGPMPEDAGERNALLGCLGDNYTDRAERVGAANVAKAGALVLEPRMQTFTRAEPDTEESDIYPWMGGGREAVAFNAYVAEALKLDRRRMDDKDLFPFGDEVADMKLSAHRTYSVQRFDARVASLQIQTFDYTGGAHEAIGESSLNWDVKRGRAFSLKDVFDDAKPWRRFATDFCLRDLQNPSAGEDALDPDRSVVEAVVADEANWLWGTDAATVHFTVYTIASFAGGEFDVAIPYAELRPYLRADAPVRPAR